MRRLIATPLVLVAMLLPLEGASAAGTAAVEFAPQHATASVGAAVAVDVTIANVDARGVGRAGALAEAALVAAAFAIAVLVWWRVGTMRTSTR